MTSTNIESMGKDISKFDIEEQNELLVLLEMNKAIKGEQLDKITKPDNYNKVLIGNENMLIPNVIFLSEFGYIDKLHTSRLPRKIKRTTFDWPINIMDYPEMVMYREMEEGVQVPFVSTTQRFKIIIMEIAKTFTKIVNSYEEATIVHQNIKIKDRTTIMISYDLSVPANKEGKKVLLKYQYSCDSKDMIIKGMSFYLSNYKIRDDVFASIEKELDEYRKICFNKKYFYGNLKIKGNKREVLNDYLEFNEMWYDFWKQRRIAGLETEENYISIDSNYKGFKKIIHLSFTKDKIKEYIDKIGIEEFNEKGFSIFEGITTYRGHNKDTIALKIGKVFGIEETENVIILHFLEIEHIDEI